MQTYLELLTLLQMLITSLSGVNNTTVQTVNPSNPVSTQQEQTVSEQTGVSVGSSVEENSGSVSSEETQTTQNTESVEACEVPELTFDEADFDHVFDGTEVTNTVTLQGSAWNNTLIKNCHVHDINGDGIVLRDVENVVITGCLFENIGGQAAVRGSVSGGTNNVTLYNNTVHNTAQNGFNFGQRINDGVDHSNLRIIGNTISDTGVFSSGGLTHSLYIQSQDALITHNNISGSRDGNGISVRSSGDVVCNNVSGTSQDGKPGIRYYSDHQTGPTETLLIDRNVVTDASIGIDIFKPVKRYDGQSGYNHLVKVFEITNNTISTNSTPLRVANEYQQSQFTVTVSGNN